MLEPQTEVVKLIIPITEGWVLPYLYENGTVNEVAYDENNAVAEVKIDKKCISRIRPFMMTQSVGKQAPGQNQNVGENGYDPSCKQ